MRLGVAVNDARGVVATQTTAMLLAAAVRLGHRVWVFGVGDVALAAGGRATAAARALPPSASDAERVVRALAEAAPAPTELGGAALDVLLVRTNPARDPARPALHELLLGLGHLLAARGVRVVNAPAGLARAASKLYLADLPPGTVPPFDVAADPDALVAAVRGRTGFSVLKPLSGTRGRGVFRVAPDDPNLGSLAELLTAGGPAMAQAWAPGGENGDVRVVLVGGMPLAVGGRVAAIRRVPAAGDFRSNLHAGGHAAPAELSDAQHATLAAIGPRLAADGLWLVGADLVGDQAIELNVFSTGGLRDAERFAGVDFAGAAIEALEALAGA